MSSLRNLTDTLTAACLHAACLGDTLRSLLSPSSQGTGPPLSTGSGVSFTQLGHQMAGLSTAASLGGEGGLGEFSIHAVGGAGARDLSLFVLAPDLLPQLCLGTINGGIKFCTLPCDKCTVGAHSRKVAVEGNHLYINAGRNAAYTNPSLPSSLFTFLGELHPHEDWLRIFQAYLDEETSGTETKAYVTPKKCKHRYLEDEANLAMDSPLELAPSFSSWDNDHPENMQAFAAALKNLESRFVSFQRATGEDVESLITKIQEVKAVIETPTLNLASAGLGEECSMIWETFTLLRDLILPQDSFQTLETNLQNLTTMVSNQQSRLGTVELTKAELGELLELLSTEQEHQAQLAQRTGLSSPSSGISSQFLAQIESCIHILEQGSGGGQDINTQKAQLKLLEARLPSDPFSIGGHTFNSKVDVALFVETEMSGLLFSLFHDTVTMLDSITDGHSKKADIMAAMYQASRIGLDEDEATHIYSVKLIIPMLLGSWKEGDKDPKFPLPGVKDFNA